MSPLPLRFTDRWGSARADRSYDDSACWHLLLGELPGVRAVAAEVRRRLAPFTGLHMTPDQWLHATVLPIGPVRTITPADMEEKLARARVALTGAAPVTVVFGSVFYHPEAIALTIAPTDGLTRVFEAARAATRDAAREGTGPADAGVPGPRAPPATSWSPRITPWFPHMTLCYSTGDQPAAPVIAALGKSVPSDPVTVDTLSLVVQNGPERHWDWQVIGTVPLGTVPSRDPARHNGAAPPKIILLTA